MHLTCEGELTSLGAPNASAVLVLRMALLSCLQDLQGDFGVPGSRSGWEFWIKTGVSCFGWMRLLTTVCGVCSSEKSFLHQKGRGSMRPGEAMPWGSCVQELQLLQASQR